MSLDTKFSSRTRVFVIMKRTAEKTPAMMGDAIHETAMGPKPSPGICDSGSFGMGLTLADEVLQ